MALYYFIDAAGERKVIGSTNIRWTGAWSGSTAYISRDAAADGFGHNWMALVANTNVALPSTFDTSLPTTWTHLVSKDTPVQSTDDELYALGMLALNTAWAGTAAAGTAAAAAASAGTLASNAYGVAYLALNTAWFGTTAAAGAQSQGNAAMAVATAALATAWEGTNAPTAQAEAAMAVATAGLSTAWVGTLAAAGAQSQGNAAMAVAVAGLETSWVGTVAASSAQSQGNAAYAVATAALNMAWTGTDAPDAAYAYNVARTALDTAWAGTASPTGMINAKGIIQIPVVLTPSAGSIATNATAGNRFRATLASSPLALSNPSGALDGQTLTWELIQDGTGSRVLNLDSQFAVGSDISSVVLSTVADKRDFLTATYSSSSNLFYVVAFVRGY